MRKTKLLSTAFSLFANILISQQIILFDSGNWKGEIKATEYGFFLFQFGMWQQTGANINDDYIISFFDEYKPLTTNEGHNTITCSYTNIGCNWPNSGNNIQNSINVKTARTISNIQKSGEETNHIFEDTKHYFGFSASSSPVTFSISGTSSISTSFTKESQFNIEGGIGHSVNVTGNLLGLASVENTLSQNIILGFAQNKGITETSGHTIGISISTGPTSFDDELYTLVPVCRIIATKQKYTFEYYDDINNDGICQEDDKKEGEVYHYYNPLVDLLFEKRLRSRGI